MNHVLLGVAIPLIPALAAYLIRGCRASFRMLILTPFLMAVAAAWAAAPDIPRLLGMHDLYARLEFEPRCDIFFFHYTIDLKETVSSLYGAGLILVLAGLLFAAWRELYLAERKES